MYENARRLNDSYVSRSIEKARPASSTARRGMLDGVLTADYAKAAKAQKIWASKWWKRLQTSRAARHRVSCTARRRRPLAFQNESIDCVVSNQVVEHLSDLDHYFSEASRVLKKAASSSQVPTTSQVGTTSAHFSGAGHLLISQIAPEKARE